MEIDRLKRSIKAIEDGPNYGTLARIEFLTSQQRELRELELTLEISLQEQQR